jgi:hypothetical protein
LISQAVFKFWENIKNFEGEFSFSVNHLTAIFARERRRRGMSFTQRYYGKSQVFIIFFSLSLKKLIVSFSPVVDDPALKSTVDL